MTEYADLPQDMKDAVTEAEWVDLLAKDSITLDVVPS
tara:strand:- start:12 stop:122 length:111 start_codon:yes stop_codon:yes gene_type:complete